MDEIARIVGRALLPGPRVCVTVYTVGGIDRDGNEVDEPIVFEGFVAEAFNFFSNEENVEAVQRIFEEMPDGYIYVEVGNYGREVYDTNEIYGTIDRMI